MNILQVCPSFYPCLDWGGVVVVVYELSVELVSRGHQLTVYTTDSCPEIKGDNHNPQNIDGIKTYYFKNMFKKLQSKFNIANPYNLGGIPRREIKNFDVIHIHEHRTFLAVIVHRYAKKHGIPYLIQAHGSVMQHTQKTFLKKIFDRIWGYDILNDASCVIALNETELTEYNLLGVPIDKIRLIPNGINLEKFKNLPCRGKFRKKHKIGEDEKIVLYLGRLNQTKGIDDLIKVFPQILDGYPETWLVIAGPDDGFGDYLLELTRNMDKIILEGPLYNQEKLEAYVDADVFVTPTFSGFPITFLEACACGTPIVTTDRGDKLDWIEDVGLIASAENLAQDKNLVRDGNLVCDENLAQDESLAHNGLAQCILKILSDDKLSHKFSKNGQKLVKERFNWQCLSLEIEELYKEISIL
ncbi:glycosyltransferase [uncultured Methanobacterium sp.]|uniref:glycosyltransferase n=1 Tax=uncultured Methanobacterium sp. TaxID=176306 RepID=UPI002AA6A412|nr:glycosyltransferase [uncultured Methanobacterium sp.]